MKTLFTLVLLSLFSCQLSAQLFYKNPSELHEKYVSGYKALFTDASSSSNSGYGGTEVLDTDSYRGDNLSSESFQYLEDVGWKLITKAEKHFGEDHSEMAMYLHNVGCLYAAYHEFGEAERLFHAALKIWASRVGHKEPQYVLTTLHLAECYILEGRIYKSNTYLNEAYEALNSFIIPENLHEINRELEAVSYYWAKGDKLAAEYFLELAIKHAPYKGNTDGTHAYLLSSLGRIYQENQRYKESVGFYKQACKIWSKQNTAMCWIYK
ncbi:MAG: tetratricopeptide repeat protein, partial [Bacteroidota bacterium]